MSIFINFDFGKYFSIIVIIIAIAIFVIPKYFSIPFSKQYFSCEVDKQVIDNTILQKNIEGNVIIYIDKIRQKIVFGKHKKENFKKISYNSALVETEMKNKFKELNIPIKLRFNRINNELEYSFLNENENRFVYSCESK